MLKYKPITGHWSSTLILIWTFRVFWSEILTFDPLIVLSFDVIFRIKHNYQTCGNVKKGITFKFELGSKDQENHSNYFWKVKSLGGNYKVSNKNYFVNFHRYFKDSIHSFELLRLFFGCITTYSIIQIVRNGEKPWLFSLLWLHLIRANVISMNMLFQC